MTFDYFASISASAEVMTPEIFTEVTNDTPERLQLYKAIAQCTDDDQRQKLKKHLPAVTWQAHFPNGKRKNAEAVPSGLFILDIDHIDNPDEVASKVKSLVKERHIIAMHKTPSTKGLRIVAECQKGLNSIQANQDELAKYIVEKVPEVKVKFDTCIKDLARLSYLVPWSYFYFWDGSVWEREADPTFCFLAGLPDESEHPTAEANTDTAVLQTEYDGVKLIDIAEKWLLCHGGLPQHGARNATLYQLALRLRYITDFNPAVIAANIPHCDLSETEVLGLCRSACTAPRGSGIPTELRLVLMSLKHTDNETGETNICEQDDSQTYLDRLPPLPIGLRESMMGLPDKVKMPVLCGVLPIAMAYATDVTIRYADGEDQRLNLMSVIYGMQASGKSAVKRVVDKWKKPMKEADKLNRAEEDKFRELKRNRGANDKLPQEPHCIIREVPITVSCSQLLKRMKNAEGKHIYSFGEELDTLRKTNSAGAWSQKYDLYRLAFDNGEWGQDYSAENAESGIVEVAYNFSIMGTLGAVRRSFKDDSVENGTASRILFAKMPSSDFEEMPEYKKGLTLSDIYMQEEQITHAAEILSNCRGFYETPYLSQAIRNWCNEKAKEAKANNDKILDTFRRRSAVIGFRCGVLYQLLESAETPQTGFHESQNSIGFALLMAEFALQNQSDLFGDAMMMLHAQAEQTRSNKSEDILASLPKIFTWKILQETAPDSTYGSLRQMVYMWKTKKKIQQKDVNVWEKN